MRKKRIRFIVTAEEWKYDEGFEECGFWKRGESIYLKMNMNTKNEIELSADIYEQIKKLGERAENRNKLGVNMNCQKP